MPATRRDNDSHSLIKSLNKAVRTQEANNLISLTKYFRSANLTLRQADEYRRQHNDEQLYVMLLRFTSLVVETIPKHRLFFKGDPAYALLRKEAIGALAELERLQLDLRLKGQVAALEAAPFTPRKTAGTTQLAAGFLPELSSAWAAAAAMPPPPPLPDVPQPEGFDLLAALPGGGSSSSAAPSAPSLVSLLPELATSIRLPAASSATLSKHAVLPAGLDSSSGFGDSSSSSSSSRAAALPSQQPDQVAPSQQRRPAYPQLEPPPAGSVEAALAGLDLSASQQQQQLASYPLPSPYDGGLALGPQEVEVVTAPAPTQPLAPGETCCTPPVQHQHQHEQQLQQQQHAPALPTSASNGGLQEVRKRQSLRDVHISVALMDEFMRYAMSNTRRGIETCGILAGKLSPDDALFTITTLIVPKQTGTTDTGAWGQDEGPRGGGRGAPTAGLQRDVEMLAEEEIFEAQDTRAVYPLGWIHTHPSQTCFLSSVDIHTHCGFQLMMDEAVAIVMAPRDPSKRVGIFRLTTPGGLGLVQRCPLRGFHAHPPTDTGQPIYELCGHVYLNPRAAFEVVDLR